ncbi:MULTISPECIES: sunset domain-containing protein [Microbacterium]|uniref:sunset domain-containing protein n=1 Tax=Microbacterium TaxID=33882 RepID=UPI00076AFBC4|nr:MULTISPECIES: hypothetical protein [Microbacterium]AMG82502.1 hypothetical protein AXH82_03215 [Microbacterium sp. PAMC 28756]QXE29353.1 hypothetical protein IZR02_13405 [Microbacterium paraoxydans]
MAFAAPLRRLRALAVTVAAALLASGLVFVATPATAATTALDPAFPGVAEALPTAVAAAADVAASPGQADPESTATVSGRVTFPTGVDVSRGRTFVAAYAPGAGVPVAAAAVTDGSYSLRVPQGDVVLGVVSEGRAVFDQGGPQSGEVLAVGTEGVVRDVQLERSALISGSVTAPKGTDITGQRVVVAVYPVSGAGTVVGAAVPVTDAGTFAVGGLPAGAYRVAFVSGAAGAVSEWWDDAPRFEKARTITLAAGATQSGVVAALEPLHRMETSVPTINGTATVGQTLRAAPGAWTSGAALGYQWYANGVAISKATASSLTLTTAHAGARITVRVTGKKAAFASATVASAATSAVLRVLTAPTPTITGTATVGQTLKVKTGTWTAGTRLTYQWYVDGVAVARATGTSFKIPSSAALKPVTVVVSGTKSGYAAASKRSKPTAAVKGILSAPTPRITGSAIVGSRLTAVASTWTGGTRLSYQWYLNGRAIARATGSTLVVTAAMVKSRITVKVTGTKSGYVTAARTSAQTAAVTYPARTTPVSTWNCPAWAPIKGNAQSMIYHVRSGAYYAKTKPEVCFSTESAAVKAGYRKSKR